MSITIENPWVELLMVNILGLFVVLFWVFVGAWWDKRKGVETISKPVWLTVVLLLFIPANVIAAIAILRS